ncbi:MAG: glycerol-3-phosphate acyltransferase [Thermincolia bacterium]
MILELFIISLAYMVGCLPVGLYVGYLWSGQDVRRFGSGGCGSRDILLVIGLEAALLVVVLEGLKGLVPLGVARILGVEGWGLVLTGLMVLIGSLWPRYPGVKGRFSISTTLGVLALTIPATAGAALALVVSCLVLFRRLSLAAWALVITLPLLGLLTTGDWLILTMIFCYSALVLAKEIQGIGRWPMLMRDGVTYKIRN